MKKPELILGIGIPGSGKSTFLKKFADNQGITYISSDEIRAKLTGSEADQSMNKEVWQIVDKIIEENISQGTSVVLDSTMVNESDRKEKIALVEAHGGIVVGLWFDIPFEIAQERNKARERVVPEHVIKHMFNTLQTDPPGLEEGFTQMYVVDENGELKAEFKAEQKIHMKDMKIT